MSAYASKNAIACYHCGEDCSSTPVIGDDKNFCCEGCKMVYSILNKNGMCDYYTISQNPGNSQKIKVRTDKFAFLDDEKISAPLLNYKDAHQTFITFYVPHIHCSSCLWLLENLHKLNKAVVSSKVNFSRKEVDVIFNHEETNLRKVAELLVSIGYEPYISFSDMHNAKPRIDKSKIFKLGVAGFCFGNVMLLSFPEYFGVNPTEYGLVLLFRILNVLLSLPVFFYSASEFYISAWKGLKHGFLNIDAPIVLAVAVTFGRSLYEVFTNTGGGYFDSMTGIVFFMLIGRILQDKTYQQLSFERDYTSYFPIAVTRVKNDAQQSVALPDIRLDDTLLIHNEELAPADGILTKGKALIDYSFVTGESIPVVKEMGEIVYAGGKQVGGNIELLVIKEVAQSYLTKLWNRDEMNANRRENERSFVHLLSRYFTWVVFAIAALAALYWGVYDTSKIWPAVTAVLIIACPCALLLSNTFTNGNILRQLGRNHLYLRNAQAIEEIGKIDTIVFDKTGTLTDSSNHLIKYDGDAIDDDIKQKIASLAAQSNHAISRAVAGYFDVKNTLPVTGFQSFTGKGISGKIGNDNIKLGSAEFVRNSNVNDEASSAWVSVNNKLLGRFFFKNQYRNDLSRLIIQLKSKFRMAVLSGDNDGEKNYLNQLFGSDNTAILFNQTPGDKLNFIKQLQHEGHKVMMIGDGLNDAGALKQADAGIAITDSTNNFTPASDGIIEADKLPLLYRFIRLCKMNKTIVIGSFIISVIYNIVGISFAVQGALSPMIAAILMPASSLSILLVTFGSSSIAAKYLGLK
ncbi:MAG TPA: heavy metal translocating P-type ATPase metal-binding domain-containing protein [Parafilimonas sp.]|nr:heavy metal translocating P-type ATPase metal-binding domain-containing protein [Parafilimonas sp.]